MVHLVVSIAAALALSITSYATTGSLWMSFLVYVVSGTMVLMTVLFADYLEIRSEDQDLSGAI